MNYLRFYIFTIFKYMYIIYINFLDEFRYMKKLIVWHYIYNIITHEHFINVNFISIQINYYHSKSSVVQNLSIKMILLCICRKNKIISIWHIKGNRRASLTLLLRFFSENLYNWMVRKMTNRMKWHCCI